MIYPLDSAIQRLNNRGQAPVVEKVDNTINTIHCMDKSLSTGLSAIGFPNTYPLDSGLSSG